ncbi:MAG: glutamate synthase-related protein, partial [Oscillospiraceae bacterium]|nr:glutamate synthase-related protein [Oscillospiraceae bacterium]
WHHDQAFANPLTGSEALDSIGRHRLRKGDNAEEHLYSPEVIHTLQQAVWNDDPALFDRYTQMVENDGPRTIRSLLDFRYDCCKSVELDEVESAESIVKRFKTGAMSYGSISQEAHECMAEAMNRLGGKSNSGEGGERPERLGTIKNSAIKQVASGRFGVTSEYLVSAQEIQIKMAQGAKPGEGGHLPGGKVWPWVAKTRYSTPGVALISPPPHHDIYSIEDLAQLIYDLKNANKNARISVKLVSEAGVGTIAAGVAKAGAQVILISGYDGGTGAAPNNSIYNAGLPWELGVAETHQTLLRNGLRSRVRVETDGKLMTGRDVAIACMLGAEEFGFATAPLICMGCVMMRVCNLDTCPVGIATQNPELRKNFKGKPEYVMNFMNYVAQEVREIMASLGIRTMDELVGRTDLLKPRTHQITRRAEMVDVSAILAHTPREECIFDPAHVYDFQLDKTPDEQVLMHMLDKGGKHRVEYNISSTDRAFGTMFGAELTRRFGTELQDDSYVVKCTGGAGQSFGAFIPKGLTLELEGDSNDYFGKGLSGGKLVVYPDRRSRFDPGENIIIGNVALYGATSGQAYIAGVAGERFCVRNSGATAVVEGVGDHGCEYMTGGTAVILGRTGRNFAAGMSGGIAYVLDEDHDLYLRVNKSLVSIEQLTEEYDIKELRSIIEAHVKATGSARGRRILEDFDQYVHEFKKIVPRDYSQMLESIAALQAKGMPREQAEMEAFKRKGA